ncbi:uncharacterized protein LOC9643043 isoform X1 [Selaginella moellendorffii]|nr:uncharacterized protein LOC9643043 isoform X1 [Selaginella moellendorffii]|eukprot:XP_002974039.2 uncharacterized protein LOC9643043 isoform X1 [Selaginella moellendorffii]
MGAMTKEEGRGEAIGYPVVHHHYYAPLDGRPPVLESSKTKSCAFQCFTVLYPIILVLGFTAFMLWPSDVKIEVQKTELVSMSWDSLKRAIVEQQQRSNDLGLDLDLKFQVQLLVRNPNYFGVRYDRIVVELGYRGDKLGRVVLEGGEIPALKVVTVDGVMDLKGMRVFVNAGSLLLDIARGRLPLETDMNFSGNLEFLLVHPHLEAKLSCDIVVNPGTNEIMEKSCLLAE